MALSVLEFGYGTFPRTVASVTFWVIAELAGFFSNSSIFVRLVLGDALIFVRGEDPVLKVDFLTRMLVLV